MAKFIIHGRKPLEGEISVSGTKNAALKMIPASILAASPCVIKNVPEISDIEKLLEIMTSIGAEIKFENHGVRINTAKVKSYCPDEKLVKKLRGSIVLIGPLLARFGKAVLSQPGGCLIGTRPIDDHLDVFKQMGIKIKYKGKKFYFSGKPKAGHIVLKKMSVTATENAIMASVFSEGITKIHVAAAEPEIKDLADFLNSMGAKIKGAGTYEIEVEGVRELKGVEYEILFDRIEAGTYIIAGIITNSEIIVGPIITEHLDLFFKKLKDAGAKFEIIKKDGKEYVKTLKHGKLISQDIDPRPYPGFATDLQPQYAVLMTQAEGRTEIFDTMFEGRFKYLEELKFMKANVEILNPNKAVICGPSELKGREVSSLDIRGGAAVVLAGLAADGETIVNDVDFIDRGYEKMDEKLKGVGADIKRVENS